MLPFPAAAMWGLSVLFMQTRAQGSTGRTWCREQEGPLASRTEVYAEQTGWGTNLSPRNPDGGGWCRVTRIRRWWCGISLVPYLPSARDDSTSNQTFHSTPPQARRKDLRRDREKISMGVPSVHHRDATHNKKKIRSWPVGLHYGQFSKKILRYQPWGLQI